MTVRHESPDPRRWWLLFNAFIVNFAAGGFAWVYVTMVVPDVLADLGLAIRDWGLLWGGIALGVMALSIPAGIVGDRLGARRVVGGGLALCGMALLARASAFGFGSMFASMVMLGFGFAFVFSNVPKALGSWFPSRQLGLANGLSLCGLGVGQGVAALTTTHLVDGLGSWRDLTQVLGVVLVALAVYWLVVVRDRAAVASPGAGGALASVASILRVRGVWVAAFCYLLYLGGHLSAAGYIPTYFTTVRGIGSEVTGFIVALGPWGFILGSALLPMVSDRIGRRKIVFIAAMCMIAAAVLAQAFLHGLPLALASLAWGFSAGAIGLVFVVPIEMDRVGPRFAGTAFGVITSFGFLGGWLFPGIGLSLAEVRPLFAFAFSSFCYVLSALLFAALPETGSVRFRETPAASGPTASDSAT